MAPPDDHSTRGTLAATWLHRAVVLALTAGVVWRILEITPLLASVPRDHERWFETTWLNLVFAVYANLLAQVVVWRVGHRPEGRNLSLFLGSFSVCLALSPIPSGEASMFERGVFAAFWTATILLSWRFWASFPRPLDRATLATLAWEKNRGWVGWINHVSANVVAGILTRRGTWFFFATVSAVFGFEMVQPGSYDYNFLARRAVSLPALDGVSMATALVAILVSVGFAWTAYRLADAEGRRRVLWVVLAQLVIGGWSAMATVFLLLARITQSAPVIWGEWFFNRSYIPLTLTVNLTGFAVAIFYSGALDLRPVINRTTVYGAMGLVLSVLFAGVEELLQSQLAGRLGITDSIATLAGAAVVALTMGPIHARMARLVKNVGTELEG